MINSGNPILNSIAIVVAVLGTYTAIMAVFAVYDTVGCFTDIDLENFSDELHGCYESLIYEQFPGWFETFVQLAEVSSVVAIVYLIIIVLWERR